MVKPIFCSNEYLVDSRGFVIGKNGKPLKPSINHKGYEIIQLMIDGKRIGIAVHTLVARAFCDGYSPEKQVNHKDGVKTHNDYTNLEWVTRKENMQHSIHILGKDKVGIHNPVARAIIGIDITTNKPKYRFDCIIDAGRYFANGDEKSARYKQNSIWRVLSGLRKSYQGCIWKYADEVE